MLLRDRQMPSCETNKTVSGGQVNQKANLERCGKQKKRPLCKRSPLFYVNMCMLIKWAQQGFFLEPAPVLRGNRVTRLRYTLLVRIAGWKQVFRPT